MRDCEATCPLSPRVVEHPAQDASGRQADEDSPDGAPRQLERWIAAIGSGDSESLGLLYDATLGRCYALAMRILRDPQAAEDVCEDVYLQVWRQAVRFDPARGNVIAWLLTMCRSRALDHLRRRKMEEARGDIETLLAFEEVPGPFDLVLGLDASSRIGEAVGRLSGAQRQVIGLAFYRGMTQQEIADHLEMPLGTVKSNTRRALAALRAAIGSDFA